ncbi:hypothetical protein DL98DRAFT_576806 [Cadophora sp. DSE1049]|nr:hypothetical protein DL98DRAFT_576806 [Cadophora sp. DSE1049]
MRLETFLAFAIFAFAIADILDTPKFSGIWPNEDLVLPTTSSSELNKDLVVFDDSKATSRDLAERQAGVVYAVLTVVLIAQKAWSAFSWAIGLFGLATSSYGVYKDCKAQFQISECLLASVGLVISAFGTGYKAYSGFSKVRVRNDGLISHGEWIDPDDASRKAESHVSLEGRSLKDASMSSENNGTWARHATFYWQGEESHYLLYRRADPEDLGFENDGSFHHYRVEDSDNVKILRAQLSKGHPGIDKRLEKRSYGVVTDYVWRNGNKNLWDSMHQSADFKDMARKTTSYLENHKQEVSCLTPIAQLGTHGGSSNSRIDNGVIAYGWNDKPYAFKGRTGAWVEGCKGRNI